MDKLLTIKPGKGGQITDSPACIYIYIYMHAVVLENVYFPDAFENAPGHAFENGVRSVRWRETLFL